MFILPEIQYTLSNTLNKLSINKNDLKDILSIYLLLIFIIIKLYYKGKL